MFKFVFYLIANINYAGTKSIKYINLIFELKCYIDNMTKNTSMHVYFKTSLKCTRLGKESVMDRETDREIDMHT
jgi:hypothetical protein